ncbi:hypothetical protein TrRE_jg7459 [Triparma retinervis]|uniref:Uncharacterized protein n=1 Tax=Triparma retinervis TaxID=2557542 RepID=A0A9W7A415_9STRA|nr:hypothetical protein TrRE_jg7459 [Triparma retinervis]
MYPIRPTVSSNNTNKHQIQDQIQDHVDNTTGGETKKRKYKCIDVLYSERASLLSKTLQVRSYDRSTQTALVKVRRDLEDKLTAATATVDDIKGHRVRILKIYSHGTERTVKNVMK